MKNESAPDGMTAAHLHEALRLAREIVYDKSGKRMSRGAPEHESSLRTLLMIVDGMALYSEIQQTVIDGITWHALEAAHDLSPDQAEKLFQAIRLESSVPARIGLKEVSTFATEHEAARTHSYLLANGIDPEDKKARLAFAWKVARRSKLKPPEKG